MDEFLVTLRVLKDVLEKKQSALESILSISCNQETVLVSPPSAERTGLFTETGLEKQKLIDDVIECDQVFQRFFENIQEDIGNYNGEAHKEARKEIIALQALISRVLEIDVAIRAQELKNSKYLHPETAPVQRAHTPAYRKQVLDALNKYKKS